MFKSLMSEGGFSLDPLSVPWQDLSAHHSRWRQNACHPADVGNILNTFEYPKFAWKAPATPTAVVGGDVTVLNTVWYSKTSLWFWSTYWIHSLSWAFGQVKWPHLMFSRAGDINPTYNVLCVDDGCDTCFGKTSININCLLKPSRLQDGSPLHLRSRMISTKLWLNYQPTKLGETSSGPTIPLRP